MTKKCADFLKNMRNSEYVQKKNFREKRKKVQIRRCKIYKKNV